jgi:hypothetical protein
MSADSVSEEVTGFDGKCKVWTGSMIEAAIGKGMAKRDYDAAIRLMKVSGCIEVLSYGNRFAPSRVLLVNRPDDEALQNFLLTVGPIAGKLEQRVNDLATALGGVDLIKELAAIAVHMGSMDERLTRLEQKVDNTKGEIT